MTEQIRLYVARHGQTHLNREMRFQGRTDAPLDEEGLVQAARLAEALPSDITRIVSSPLLRARQTADRVATRRGLPVQYMGAFRERDYGIFEGLNRADIDAHHAELWQRQIVRQWDDAPPGGESMREVRWRVTHGLRALGQEHAGQTVLLVAHGFVARMIHLLLQGLPEDCIHAGEMLGHCAFGSYTLETGWVP